MPDEPENREGTDNDVHVDTHVEARTADSTEDLNVEDQRTPEGAQLVPGAGNDPDRTDEARRFRVATADVGDVLVTVQPDGAEVRSIVVDTGAKQADGSPLRQVTIERVDR